MYVQTWQCVFNIFPRKRKLTWEESLHEASPLNRAAEGTTPAHPLLLGVRCGKQQAGCHVLPVTRSPAPQDERGSCRRWSAKYWKGLLREQTSELLHAASHQSSIAWDRGVHRYILTQHIGELGINSFTHGINNTVLRLAFLFLRKRTRKKKQHSCGSNEQSAQCTSAIVASKFQSFVWLSSRDLTQATLFCFTSAQKHREKSQCRTLNTISAY